MRNSEAASLVIAAALLLGIPAAHAQDAAMVDKLRDMLRQTTVAARAAQDNAATLQTQLDSMTQQRDALQHKLDDASAKPVAVAPPPLDNTALRDAQQAAAAAQSNEARATQAARTLQAQLGAAQARLQQASDEQARVGRSIKTASAALDTCRTTNSKLVQLSTEILHMYETPQFRSLLVASHDRLIGFKRVQLENLVQDYDDKIDAQTLAPLAAAPAP